MPKHKVAPVAVTNWRDLPLPDIDNSTPKLWAKTWLDQLQWAVDYVQSGAKPLHYGGDYRSYVADLTAGDVPWDERNYRNFARHRANDPRWRKLKPILDGWGRGNFAVTTKHTITAILADGDADGDAIPPTAAERKIIAEATVLREQLLQFKRKLRRRNYESPVTRLRNAVDELTEVICDFGGPEWEQLKD